MIYRFGFAFLFLVFSFTTIAQVVNKDYVVKQGDGFTLYFISPIGTFKTRDSKQSDKLDLDVTHKSNEDVVVLNMSFRTNQKFTVDSVLLMRADSTIFSLIAPDVLYVDMLKKGVREYRYTLVMPFDALAHFFSESKTSSGKVVLCSGQDCRSLSLKTRAWRKNASMVTNILALIEENQ